MTPHLQESTLVDTCLQYQISTTDFQVNLLCSSKETSIFEYVNLLSGKKPLTKFYQLILEAALHWTTLVERQLSSSAAAKQQRQVGRRLAESIRYKDSPCTVTSITVDGSSAPCGTAVSTIERGNWSQSKLPLVFWCGHLDLACTRDMTHGCLLSLLACPAAQPLSFYATTYLIRVSGPPKSFASFGRGLRSSSGQ